ncbi:hypothetical protein M513_11796 [Trichuris suis]|uniref:Uncharacterized protein n=1 Tax=Trichuris suis TaxID=68888 RepID=A0A085LQU2_9BILA|nr:hypothetical protein M513_11796 [Trichuris suis]
MTPAVSLGVNSLCFAVSHLRLIAALTASKKTLLTNLFTLATSLAELSKCCDWEQHTNITPYHGENLTDIMLSAHYVNRSNKRFGLSLYSLKGFLGIYSFPQMLTQVKKYCVREKIPPEVLMVLYDDDDDAPSHAAGISFLHSNNDNNTLTPDNWLVSF